jgi:hypothetical protein
LNDNKDGSVAWEANGEVSYALGTVKENGITFRLIVGQAAKHILESLPQAKS